MLLFCETHFFSSTSKRTVFYVSVLCSIIYIESRDEDKIKKACYWPHEIFESCFAGCAEVTCDNPRVRLRTCYPYCEPGCVCADPYVRDDRTHQCVLPSECTITLMGIPLNSDPDATTTPPADELRNQRNRRWNRPQEWQEQHFINHSPSYRRKPQLDQPDGEIPLRVGEQNPAQDYVARGPMEYSRLGNFFNIVIAPPQAKGLTWRKTMAAREEQGLHHNFEGRRFEH